MTTRTLSRSRRRTALLAALTLIFTAGVHAPQASAQQAASRPAAPPPGTAYAEFQSSTLSGSGNVISVVNVPVVNSSGVVTYDNVTITFNVSSSGGLSVASTKVVAAVQTQSDGFEAGTYVAAGNGETITVTGPGVASGGSTIWSFATTSAGCQEQYSATWYVGAIASSPYYTRVTNAAVPLNGYSYGVGGGNCNYTNWGADSLLGFSQTPGQLVISSFTSGNDGADQNEPTAIITYNKQ